MDISRGKLNSYIKTTFLNEEYTFKICHNNNNNIIIIINNNNNNNNKIVKITLLNVSTYSQFPLIAFDCG